MPIQRWFRWVVPGTVGLWLVVALPTVAYAYIDPGVGSMVWQLAMAGLLTAAYFGRRILRWLGTVLGLGRSPAPESHEPPDATR